MAKKRKTGPRPETYNSMAERDDAARGKRDPFGSTKVGDVAQSHWIEAEDPTKDLSEVVKTLIKAQGRRLWENTFFMSLYANVDFMSPYWGSRGGQMGFGGVGPDAAAAMPRMSDNMVRMCVDALTGKLIQSNSRIVMQTRMGDFSEWMKARKIELALEGEFAKMRLYREIQQVAVDALTQGDGFLKLYPDYDGKSIVAERLFPNEVFIDELEGAYGPPKKLYQLCYRRKDDIYAWFPDKYEIIRKAGTTMPPRFAWTLYQPGMAEIYEAWALPVGNRKGRHVIAVSSGVLLDEEWDKPYFPIVRFKAGDRPFGWYGAGWVEQVATTQVDLNKTWSVLQRAAHMGIAPYILTQSGSNVNVDHLTNDVATIVQTDGVDPKWVVNPPFHPGAADYLNMLKQTILTFFGMNEMEVTGELPVNRLDSSEALREFQAMGSVRHTMLLERWQEFFVDVAERVCMLASDIAKANGGYPVMVKKAYAKAVQLDWKQLQIEKDSYMMNPAPANILPITSAGRVQKLQELKADGLIGPQQAARAIASGQDVEAILAEVTADDDNIDRIIEKFTEFGEYVQPNSLMNLQHALVRMSNARLKYENLGADDATLALFDRFLADCKDLVAMMTPPAPMGAPPGAAPGAAPAPGAPGSGAQPIPGATNQPMSPAG